jgi:hypothetical protein
MDNKNLFKEAIADAKAVREAALANAKAALEEALTPKLQSMLATKLQEMEYEEEAMGGEDEMEEGFLTSHGDDSDENLDFNLEEEMEDESMDEDFDLSEILAELEEEEMEEKLNKGGYTGSLKDKDEKTTVATAQHDTAYSKLAEAKDEDEEESEETETEEVADMSVEDLKALIKDIVSQEMGGEEEMHAEPDADNAGGPSDHDADNADDEINLDELLAELDALGEGDDMEEESMYEAKKRMSKHEKGETKAQEKAEHASGKEKKEKSEMKEAIDTINTLRAELNEVNLLNAKLLYVNKIFKAKNLSESQKLKVIASFDKATTAKEAKVVFESLNSTLTAAAPKQAIKESIGFASKAAGTAPRKAIVETNDAITRMQKLANIIK